MCRKPKHILYIIADELRADCISPYGNQEVHTPSLEHLARDGVTYGNAFCTFPVCTPSRYSMMTGLYAYQHRCIDNRTSIPADLPTLPKLMREKGYLTSAVGKLHCNPPRQEMGFDRCLLAEQCGDGRYEDDYHQFLREQGLCDVIDMMDQCSEWRDRAPAGYWESFGNRPEILPENKDSTSWIGENALREIKEWGEEDHFLMVSFIKPHHPFDAPTEWRQKYDPASLSLLPGWTECVPEVDYRRDQGYFDNARLTEVIQKQILASYYASITQIDFWIGRMVEMLQSKGIYEDTMIVFTADHGDYMGFHHMVLKCNHMYDPVMRIPLLVKYAGERGGQMERGLCSHVDLFATILQQCQIGLPPSIPGKNLKDLKENEYVFSQQTAYGKPEYMIRTFRHKLILSVQGGMLFDLEDDPFELDNRYEENSYQLIRRELEEILHNHLMFEAPLVPCYDRSLVYGVEDLKKIQENKAYFNGKAENSRIESLIF